MTVHLSSNKNSNKNEKILRLLKFKIYILAKTYFYHKIYYPFGSRRFKKPRASAGRELSLESIVHMCLKYTLY